MAEFSGWRVGFTREETLGRDIRSHRFHAFVFFPRILTPDIPSYYVFRFLESVWKPAPVNRINLFQSSRRLMEAEVLVPSPLPLLSLSLSPLSLSVSSLLRSFQRRGRQPLGNPGLLSKRGLMSHRRDLFLQRDILSFILPSLPTEPGVRISPYP